MTELFEEKPLTRAKQDLFIAKLAHDLKNPLQAQIISLDLLSKGLFGELTPKQSEMIAYTAESAKFMCKMLYTMLDLYKYNNCNLTLNKSEFNLLKLIEHCINEFRGQAQMKNITFIKEVANPSNNITIYADKIHIRRVFENLINNALNYCFANSTIQIFISKTNNKTLISFTNKATEIPEEDCKNLFSEKKSNSQFNGYGIGLNSSKQIIEAHNGKISFKKNMNNYTFTVELPN